jgi:hypothetical protein
MALASSRWCPIQRPLTRSQSSRSTCRRTRQMFQQYWWVAFVPTRAAWRSCPNATIRATDAWTCLIFRVVAGPRCRRLWWPSRVLSPRTLPIARFSPVACMASSSWPPKRTRRSPSVSTLARTFRSSSMSLLALAAFLRTSTGPLSSLTTMPRPFRRTAPSTRSAPISIPLCRPRPRPRPTSPRSRSTARSTTTPVRASSPTSTLPVPPARPTGCARRRARASSSLSSTSPSTQTLAITRCATRRLHVR